MTHAELVRVVAAGIVRTRFPRLAHDPAWTDKEIRESDLEEAAPPYPPSGRMGSRWWILNGYAKSSLRVDVS